MGINIKYYIISIAAIFVSLGIGIFIGFNMNGQEIYLNQQQVLVDSLENRFTEFKKEKENLDEIINNLNIEKENQNLFIGNMFYEITHNKLEERNIAIIETTDDYSYEDIQESLRLSGASILKYVKYMEKIHSVTEVELWEIGQLLGVRLERNEDFIDFINKEIIDSFVVEDISEALKFLIDREYIQYNYDLKKLENLNIDSIVIAGGSTEDKEYKSEELDMKLIRSLQEEEFRIIGVEKLDVEQSYIPTFKKLNISTVDNIDSMMGKISLIYLLEGAQGHYGEKSTADSLAPFIVIDPLVRSEKLE